MQAGRLDRRVQLQSATKVQDGYGQEVKTWATYATVWATVKDQSGREFLASAQVDAQTATQFMVRWRDDIAEGHRIVHDSVNYNITAVLYPENRKSHITLMAVRGTNSG